MATNPETIKISQMPTIMVVPEDSELPVVVGGTNFRTTAKSLLKNVTNISIGLPLVQNIAPDDMPVSREQQQALDKKLDRDTNIPISMVDGLQAKLDEIENADIPISRIPGFNPEVQRIIDAQPPVEASVIQGAHAW